MFKNYLPKSEALYKQNFVVHIALIFARKITSFLVVPKLRKYHVYGRYIICNIWYWPRTSVDECSPCLSIYPGPSIWQTIASAHLAFDMIFLVGALMQKRNIALCEQHSCRGQYLPTMNGDVIAAKFYLLMCEDTFVLRWQGKKKISKPHFRK